MEDYDTRRDNGGSGVAVPPCTCSGEEFRASGGGKGSLRVVAAARNGSSVSNYDMAVSRNVKKTQKRKGLQELFTADYIVNRVLRKDGPSLGQEFDFLPSGPRHTSACQEDQGSSKKRKGSKSAIQSLTDCNRTAPVKKHGIGKGLMTVWRATNPDAGDLPINFGVDGQEVPLLSNSIGLKLIHENNRSRKTVNRNGELNLGVTQNQSPNKSCGLALDNAISEEGVDRVSMLIDDEELELRELQVETDLFRCSNHLAASGMLVCSLCKDALVKFPPDTVKMKKPIHLQPWDSSPEIVKKLFKVFHFIYTYAIIVDICPFTLDELVQAFHDKDSMLLGKIHVALLTLLLSDIEAELTNGFSPHLNKSCNFLALLHSVESQEYSLDFWRRSLNSLTWIEILRQVLVASGFGSKQGSLRRDVLNKELNLLVNYGLCPGTLKSELFNILSERGNTGCKVVELAKSMQDLSKVSADCNSSIQLPGSGAKIKRSVVTKPGSLLNHKVHLNSDPCSVDSSLLFSRFHSYEAYFQKGNGPSMSHPIQSVFLGSDRRYNRYWLFLGPCNVDDPGHRRIYFESSEDGHWEVIDTVEALCALMSVLDDRGKREALLIESLERRQTSLCRSMARINVNSTGMGSMSHSDQSELDMVTDDSYSPASDVDNLNMTETAKDSFPSAGAVVIEAGKKVEDLIKKWIRVQEYDSWIWNSFYSDLNVVKYGRRSYMDSLAKCKSCHDLYWRDERHCKICHMTFELDFDLEEKYAIHIATCREKEDNNTFPNHKVLPSQIQSLKAAVYAIESVMPEDALVGAWRKSAHKLWVKRLRRTSTLVELLQVLDDFVGAINKDWLFQCKFPDDVFEEIISSFASMPRTSSALGLWLVKLDVIIAPYLDRVHPLKKQGTGQHGPWR
ncbi:homeobox-DDT domain protein RLT3 isoform X4 [Vigna angularis]|uniref:homeobox-DDT domain protein RLT3 isoform X4 n=1 Tax=Phaseolus angularis TaxID=3914 RepID=UPI0022B4C6FF|nr:homeobox-DDT domain protein RLT3 isoform X4 [Vigna angularis]